ncbi:MAG: hypothetical protein ABFC85_04780 [Rectinema sp.]|uniref:Lipoprotein n=1 Tax=uncultured spirochete TaxID=156406 RepID=A0A3P3XUG7_9SPIR|nr:exported hypothetical protein [uncultured spirochete]
MRLRTLILVVFSLLSAACAFSQTPPVPATMPAPPQTGAPSSPGQESAPSLTPAAPPNVPVFQFHFRAAFMLTPAMVAAIQSASLNAQDSKSKSNSFSDRENNPAWEDPILREVSLAAPLGIKIQGERLVAMIVFIPVELVKKDLTMLVQNQIYARSPDNSIQMNTSVHTVRVPLGALFYYYPLGGDAKQGAAVAIEILINQK